MYERFTDRARRVVKLASQEAQRFNHGEVGTEHLLLGLVKEGSGVAAEALERLGVDLRRVRSTTELVHPPAFLTSTTELKGAGGYVPPSNNPWMVKALTGAGEEAKVLDHKHVGTEHLLLAMLRDRTSTGCVVLSQLGVMVEEVRAEVFDLLGMPDPELPVVGMSAEDDEEVEDVDLDVEAVKRNMAGWMGVSNLLSPLPVHRARIATAQAVVGIETTGTADPRWKMVDAAARFLVNEFRLDGDSKEAKP